LAEGRSVPSTLFILDGGCFGVKAAIGSRGLISVRHLGIAVDELPRQLLLGTRDPILKRPLKRACCGIAVLRFVHLDCEQSIRRASYCVTWCQQGGIGFHREVPVIGLRVRAVAEYQTNAMRRTGEEEAGRPI